MPNNGWIKLHRKMMEKGWYKNSQYVHLWTHILLKANHKAKEVMWNGQIVNIKAGQFISGRKRLSKATGIPESTIERVLKLFENEHQIEQQKTTKFRLITVINWEGHQASEQHNGQQADNRRTTSGHKQEGRRMYKKTGVFKKPQTNAPVDNSYENRSKEYEEYYGAGIKPLR